MRKAPGSSVSKIGSGAPLPPCPHHLDAKKMITMQAPKCSNAAQTPNFRPDLSRAVILLPIVTDETRAGERTLDLKLGEVLSGTGPCELWSLPACCLWRLDRLFLLHYFLSALTSLIPILPVKYQIDLRNGLSTDACFQIPQNLILPNFRADV